jgi:hypothetical protein
MAADAEMTKAGGRWLTDATSANSLRDRVVLMADENHEYRGHSIEISDGPTGLELFVDGSPVLIRAHGDHYILDEDAFTPAADPMELARRFIVAEAANQYRRDHEREASAEE